MRNRFWSKHIGEIAIFSGVIGASIYLMMVNVTLAHIQATSGHVPFDLRPFGYSPTDTATILGALGVDGRKYYLTHQILLDTLYPAMLTLTLVATICWFQQRMPDGMLFPLGIFFSVGAALFDYAENLFISAMIWSWPDVSIPLVYASSTATIAKSAFTTAAVLLVLLIGLNWARCRKYA